MLKKKKKLGRLQKSRLGRSSAPYTTNPLPVSSSQFAPHTLVLHLFPPSLPPPHTSLVLLPSSNVQPVLLIHIPLTDPFPVSVSIAANSFPAPFLVFSYRFHHPPSFHPQWQLHWFTPMPDFLQLLSPPLHLNKMASSSMLPICQQGPMRTGDIGSRCPPLVHKQAPVQNNGSGSYIKKF